ncbi:MAG: LysM peptidoglycan-binding domain-containing protein [Polyangiaceae bacterium]
MRIRLAAGAALAVLGLLFTPAETSAQSKPSQKPAAAAKARSKPRSTARKPPTKSPSKPSRPTPKSSSKKGSKKAASRKSGEPSEPDEATRRIIAGLAAERNVRESSELSSMRQVDLALFPGTKPDAGQPWPVSGSPLVDLDPKAPVVSTSGLPPEGQLTAISAPAPAKDMAWLKKLDMPDIPVRWDARVIRYLEFYKNDPRGRSMATVFIRKSGRYGGAIRRTLREQGIPEDILWLSLVESGFEPTIHSPAGAAGLWQFMPEGARIYGLYVDRWVDERHDPERSTLAAARYLADLKTRFGSWELAFAAYNMGYGGLLAAIKKYNTNDFWELSKLEAGVPFETALYVPKIMAIAIVARNKAVFGVEDVELDKAVTFDKISVESGVTIDSVAKAAGVSADVIESMNPQILAGRTPPLAPGLTVDVKWTLRVPEGAGARTAKSLPPLISAQPKLARHTVRFGESLEDIASARKTTRSSIAHLNGLKSGESLRPGTVIFVPATTATPDPSATRPLVVVPAQAFSTPGKRRVFYRVVSGDTLSEVAAVLATTAEDLAKWNILDPGARLHDGMTLQAYVGEKQVLAGALVLEERDARILTVGTKEFFAHFESQKGRDRVFVTVKEGDTFSGLARRYGLSVGMLERINQRSRSGQLTPGERLVVYVPASRNLAPDKSDDKPDVAVASATPATSSADTAPDAPAEGGKSAPAEKDDKPSSGSAPTASADKPEDKAPPPSAEPASSTVPASAPGTAPAPPPPTASAPTPAPSAPAPKPL